MLPYFSEVFGNPMSSQHSFGWQAKEAVEKARGQVAKLIGAQAREITFTSGATESIHLAILGLFRHAEAETQKKYHLITSLVEHKCSLEVARQLENLGHQVTYLAVNEYGQIQVEELKKALQENTLLVSVLHANNEIGSINPIREISEICRSRDILLHLDSAQICGKHDINVVEQHIDLLSLSAHKLYGPKGVGAIYMRQTQPRVRVSPYIFGGGQERGLRSGTQNVPGIVGLGEACEMCGDDLTEENLRQKNLRDHFIKRIFKEIDGVVLNGHPTERLCNNISLSIESVLPDQMLMAMSEVAFSSGSACASGEDSHVLNQIRKLQAISAPQMKNKDYFTLRFGLGRSTRPEDVDAVCDLLRSTVAKVRPLSKFNL
jgi:cysteine desulfurase